MYPQDDWRQKLSFGSPDKGRRLPSHLRCSMEEFFRRDLSSIRIHFSSLPERFGAMAFTHGTDIYLVPVWGKLTSYEQLFLLGHELAHVVQQWKSSFPASTNGRVSKLSDGLMEAEADQVGHDFARSMMQITPSLPKHEKLPLRRGDTNWQFIQYYLAIKLPTMPQPEELTDVDKAYSDVLSKSVASLHGPLTLHKDEIKEVLGRWISAYNYGAIRFILSQAAVRRTYDSWSNLALALIGEITSGPNLLIENDLARRTKSRGYINDHLATLIGKVAIKVDLEPDSTARKSLKSKWHKGKYYPWYYTLWGGFPAVMSTPTKYSFSSKVAVLHDLSDFFYETNVVGATTVPIAQQQAWAIVGQNPISGSNIYNKVPMGATTNFRHADGTLIESSPIIAAARQNKMPLSYGPSYTTGRLMQLTHFSGGTPDEFQAMAWGIFAFWNQDYYTSQSGIHRFHCVMDMAENYGVPYTAFTYPDDPPDYALTVVIV